jgi:DNA-directed RNA polymerase subunit RPC12/RpoP
MISPARDTIQSRASLNKYYRYVHICLICKKEYGTDTKKIKDKGTCPTCLYKINLP